MSNLEEFVLGMIRQAGGIVDPPAYGAYPVLLPEALALRLGVPPFQRVSFVESPPEGAVPLGYAHPLVEALVEAALEAPACARFFVNAVRLDKRGMAALARKSLSFPNGRLRENPLVVESRALFHLLQVNFKVALITDEKREQFTSVWMDVQGGHPVEDLTPEMHLPLEAEAHLPPLPAAPLRWLPAQPAGDQIPPEALAALLEAAAQEAVRRLTGPIERLQARAVRYLNLDRARLEQYYDDMEADLTRRLARAQDEARQVLAKGRLEAIRAERVAKLADVEAKYRLRLEFEPINLALITLPKVQLPVWIENRHARAEQMLIWDPLRHALEPLVCEVCRRPTTTALLCAEGHLLCTDPACSAPQCVDCKRRYCRNCASQVTTCEVCQSSVCRRSLIRCDECGRGTCREHVSLCHAAGGLPQPIEHPSPVASAPLAPIGEPVSRREPSKPPMDRRSRAKKGPAAKPTRKAPAPLRYTNLRLDVQISTSEPVITAFVYKSGGREVAYREWRLVEEGILTRCDCEKASRCPAQGMISLPAHAGEIETQLEDNIELLREEYHVAPVRVRFVIGTGLGDFRKSPRLVLRGAWKDEARLSAARAAFKTTFRRK